MVQNLTAEQLATLRVFRGQGVGPVTFFKLLEHYKTAENALAACLAGHVRFKPAPLAQVEVEAQNLAALKGQYLFFSDAHYPAALKMIADPPPVLSVLGDVSLLNTPSLAIVGARNASANGQKMAQNLAEELAQKGYTVVSGLARGVDGAAHLGALRAGGKTIAVLGGGVDHIYPPENKALYHQIAANGAIIAETPVGVRPTAQSFPRRNRIVAGLCKGVVVVEAARHSGSLITAQMAGEQGRDVMAVPGHPFDPRSAGANHLLRQGAGLVQCAEDVLEVIGNFSHMPLVPASPVFYAREAHEEAGETSVTVSHGEEVTEIKETPETLEQKLLTLLSADRTLIDDLLTPLQTDMPTLSALLSELEVDGKLERLAGGYVTLLK